MNRRKSVLAAVALMTVCGVWVGLAAPPASASPQSSTEVSAISDGVVVESVTTSFIPTVKSVTGEPGLAPSATAVKRVHNWYYRIYLSPSGQTLFRWSFRTEYNFLLNQYFISMLPTDSVTFRDSVSGDPVRYVIRATAAGISGPLAVFYEGAEFRYCPNGTCVKTFKPTLAWVYNLNDQRLYVGSPPLV